MPRSRVRVGWGLAGGWFEAGVIGRVFGVINDAGWGMDYIPATIELSNPSEPNLQPIKAQALADSVALMVCIPQHLALQLNLLQQESEREVTVAYGRGGSSGVKVPYVDPVKVAFQDRICFVGALVLGDTVLLGAVPKQAAELLRGNGQAGGRRSEKYCWT